MAVATWSAWVGNCILPSLWAAALLSHVLASPVPASVLGANPAMLGARQGSARHSWGHSGTGWAGAWRGQHLPGAGAWLAVDGSNAVRRPGPPDTLRTTNQAMAESSSRGGAGDEIKL